MQLYIPMRTWHPYLIATTLCPKGFCKCLHLRCMITHECVGIRVEIYSDEYKWSSEVGGALCAVLAGSYSSECKGGTSTENATENLR